MNIQFLIYGVWNRTQYSDVIMGVMASQTTSLTIVCSTVYSGADQRKHQSSASLVFVRGIHWWPVNSPHKEPVTRKMFPFDDVIMSIRTWFVLLCFAVVIWLPSASEVTLYRTVPNHNKQQNVPYFTGYAVVTKMWDCRDISLDVPGLSMI